MIAKEIRQLSNMCSSAYDLQNMLELGGQPASNAMVALNQMTTAVSQHTQAGHTTVKRRKKSSAAPNPKKMFEESQMVRRVKAYLNNLQIITDEMKLHEMSLECEGNTSNSSSNTAIPRGKRHPSPAPSTTSSNSSASDERKPTAKFGKNSYRTRIIFLTKPSVTFLGSASPQAVRKLLALSESTKTRPHQPRQPPPILPILGLNQPSPIVRRVPSATGEY